MAIKKHFIDEGECCLMIKKGEYLDGQGAPRVEIVMDEEEFWFNNPDELQEFINDLQEAKTHLETKE